MDQLQYRQNVVAGRKKNRVNYLLTRLGAREGANLVHGVGSDPSSYSIEARAREYRFKSQKSGCLDPANTAARTTMPQISERSPDVLTRTRKPYDRYFR
jgi:hypothetical protein